MNIKLRFQNKTTLASIVTLVIAIVYQVLHLVGVIPAIDQQAVLDVALMVVDLLALLGVVVDPTTDGIKDSSRALSYDEPATETVFRHDDNRRGA